MDLQDESTWPELTVQPASPKTRDTALKGIVEVFQEEYARTFLRKWLFWAAKLQADEDLDAYTVLVPVNALDNAEEAVLEWSVENKWVQITGRTRSDGLLQGVYVTFTVIGIQQIVGKELMTGARY